ncbi:MAG: flavodoxin [Bacteroidota bacterium]|nr:flavodoxin [Bacteroidota bacterium]
MLNKFIEVGMIQLFYGSDTQKTHEVVQSTILPLLRLEGVEVQEKVIPELTDEDWIEHDMFILGVPTWYYGELQSDWEAYFDHFKTLDFTGKTVALFGLGDQWGYDEWFIDGVGILAEVLLENGAELICPWPTEGYDFQKSRALKNEGEFYGLALDEDNQYELTKSRCELWVPQVVAAFTERGLELQSALPADVPNDEIPLDHTGLL